MEKLQVAEREGPHFSANTEKERDVSRKELEALVKKMDGRH